MDKMSLLVCLPWCPCGVMTKVKSIHVTCTMCIQIREYISVATCTAYAKLSLHTKYKRHLDVITVLNLAVQDRTKEHQRDPKNGASN